MGLATLPGTKLRYIDDSQPSGGAPGGLTAPQAYIKIPNTLMDGGDYSASGGFQSPYIRMYILPDISDSKGASYNNEPIPGRSFPLKTYAYSEDRQISIQLHMVTDCEDRVYENLGYLRMLQSAVYPQESNTMPYYPPPVCQIVCGQLLGNKPLNAVLKNYSVRFPTDQAWHEWTFLPAKFDVDTSWDIVYRPTNLPGQAMILMDWTSGNSEAVTDFNSFA
jgi:hypothetical protein